MPGRSGRIAQAASSLLARTLPRRAYLRLNARIKLGYWPDLAHPMTFAERLLLRSLTVDDPRLASTGSKVGVRDHVLERLGPAYLPRLVQVLRPGDHVDLASWPPTAVMKASHASNWIRFVERDRVTGAELDAVAARWLGRSYAVHRAERHYAAMEPAVVVEEDLRRNGRTPDDFKLYVFDGRVRMVVVDGDRFGAHTRFLADAGWRALDVRYLYPPPAVDVARPQRWSELVAIAERLGAGFPFVRVDLYVVDDRLLVGEMTHFPDGGVPRFPKAFDRELGAVWAEGRAIDPRWWRPTRSADVPAT